MVQYGDVFGASAMPPLVVLIPFQPGSQVSHPLLPSKAVHDPISKLIAAAAAAASSSSSGGGGGGRKSSRSGGAQAGRSTGRILGGQRRTATQTAEEQVQINLARLLGTIWRKLREESAQLDFFLREDRDAGGGDTQKQRPQKARFTLEVFSSLLRLLELPGPAGLHAREACLVALSVKDRRVGLFVGSRTQFCAQLSRTLTARYLALYDTLEELQVSTALLVASDGESYAAGGESGSRNKTKQLEKADNTFSEALSLFLQHLRFCNAVGLVAADSYASTRPVGNRAVHHGGGGSVECKGVPAPVEVGPEPAGATMGDDVGSSLASQVRESLLGEAIGPALFSALESRAGIAQAIAARIITELSAGLEGYGVAAAGIAARDGQAGCRRKLGPLLDTASSFLVGRERSWGEECNGEGILEEQEQGSNDPAAEQTPTLSDRQALDKSSGRCGDVLTLRSILLERLRSSSPGLRVSTLELVASLAELRDDRVLLDLAIRPERKASMTVGAEQQGPTAAREQEKREEQEGGCEEKILVAVEDGVPAAADRNIPIDRGGVFALLEYGGPLEGLSVTRRMVDSFGAAFGGSPIHPNFRRFASHVSLEEYLVEAHQRQIQQLMEARVSHGGKKEAEKMDHQGEEDNKGQTEEQLRLEVTAGGQEQEISATATIPPASVVEGETEGTNTGAAGTVDQAVVGGTGGAMESVVPEQFDAAEFVRQHGGVLAKAADAEGSFLHALFDCLEVSTRGRSLRWRVLKTDHNGRGRLAKDEGLVACACFVLFCLLSYVSRRASLLHSVI